MSSGTLEIRSYEHVGIRVTDRDRAVAFYEKIGFRCDVEYLESPSKAIEMVNPYGVRINLICNGAPREGAYNVLQDAPVKEPGITHVAFVIPDLDQAVRDLARAGIPLSDGPRGVPRRRYVFFRDPDGNVIEINEFLPAAPLSPA